MTNLFSSIKKRFKPIEQLPSGIYHFQSPPENPLNYRLHLRIDNDGSGLLLINGSTILHLNPTAIELANHIISESTEFQVGKDMASRYRINKKIAISDFLRLKDQIETLLTTPDLDPITYFDFDRNIPYSEDLSAPYRLDCALTYNFPKTIYNDQLLTKRVDKELTKEEWIKIIDIAWAAGIPHILFTGGEPTTRDDLPELIAHAENNGQITGILTNGYRLNDTVYLKSLLDAGLDHTMIILEPNNDNSWDSLSSFTYWSEALDEDIFISAHLTLTKENSENYLQLLNKITEAGVSAISISENDKSLSDELMLAREYISDNNVDLIWDLPVPYSNLNPVSLELENESDEVHPNGAGIGWLYVEPDGDVLPSQGFTNPIGNMLVNTWDEIWNSALKSN